MADPKIGLVLGGGGARGLSHAIILEIFDELGIRPHAIAGSSIGSLIGAGYASGMSGSEIRENAIETFDDRTAVLAKLWDMRPSSLQQWFSPKSYSFGNIDPERILSLFTPIDRLPPRLEDLSIPLSVVASDYYDWHDVAFSQGPLDKLVAASIAIPGLFKPVEFEGRTLVDGNVTNPLPFDRLPRECDLVIGVDVVGGPLTDAEDEKNGVVASLVGSAQIMMQAITNEKLKNDPDGVDLVITPPIEFFNALNFLKASLIFRAVRAEKDQIKQKITDQIEAYSSKS